MATTLSIKSGNTKPAFTDTLTLGGSAANLAGASVLFVLKQGKTNFRYTSAASIVSAAAGTVAFGGPLPADFPKNPGVYDQEWHVTFSDSSTQSFPQDDNNGVIILR